MQVFKFGGASVKNSESVRNLHSILQHFNDNIIIVVSAMGKTTNALEQVLENYFNANNQIDENLQTIKNYHYNIVNELFTNKNHLVFEQLNKTFAQLDFFLTREPSLNYNFEYDKIVSFGEIISTIIVSNYLNENSFENKWIDIRKCLKTDSTFRESKINWSLTEDLMKKTFDFAKNQHFVTQGFIGSDINNQSTTLGREGSDFTASIIANILNANEVKIWKDVAGIFNADPHVFPNPAKLSKLSYQEAIELSYYGAKVIHPQTIKPLQNKNIPLYVKSFIEPLSEGTIIHNFKENIFPRMPVYILNENQILISFSTTDFSFITETSIEKIFATVAKYRIKVNLMQNSALDFSICVDNNKQKIKPLIEELKSTFRIFYNENLKLFTIRHYTDLAINNFINDSKIFLQQKTRSTAIFLVPEV